MVHSLPHNWLDLAIAHAATGWLKRSLQTLLPPLVSGALTSEAFAAAFADQLSERKLSLPSQQKNYRSNVVQALKSIDPQHPAIALVALSTEQYRDLNEAQRGRLADRETKFITPNNAVVLVAQATGLLDSAQWSEVAAGLAVLIGRRVSEILLSRFAPKTAWSLVFSEMAKKAAGATGMAIEIPTLAPAEQVLQAIHKLQKGLRIDDLKLESLTPKNAKQAVNQRYSPAIAKACHDHFAALVPSRADGENLYTHIFRACYATIAAHWFCPPQVPEYSFKAEIQGHFTLTQDGRKLPNYAARANYDDYAIGDGTGNRDGRLGIKLGTLPALEVIEAFQKPVKPGQKERSAQANALEEKASQTEGEAIDMTNQTLAKGTMNALCYRAAGLLAGTSWAELAVGLELLTGITVAVLTTAPIEARSPYVLMVDGRETNTLVQQLLPTIERFRLMPKGNLEDMEVVCEQTFGELLPVKRIDLPRLYRQVLAARTQTEATPVDSAIGKVPENRAVANLADNNLEAQPTPLAPEQTAVDGLLKEDDPVKETIVKSRTKRPELHADDLSKMIELMAKRGVVGATAEVFQALVEVFEQEQAGQQQQQVQTIGEVAMTLNWFTGEIQSLRTRVSELEQEREQLRAKQGQSHESVQLRAENVALKQALQHTQARLEGIQQLLGMQGQATAATQRALSTPAAANESELRTRATPGGQAVALPQAGMSGGQSIEGAFPTAAASTTRRNRGETTAKIHQVIDALMRWNTSQVDAAKQLRISIPTIKGLASALGANYQPAIQAVLQERAAELEEMHSQLMLGTRHNASVPHKDEILRAIAQGELGLEHWQEVRYSG